jgi:hypothetical protein
MGQPSHAIHTRFLWAIIIFVELSFFNLNWNSLPIKAVCRHSLLSWDKAQQLTSQNNDNAICQWNIWLISILHFHGWKSTYDLIWITREGLPIEEKSLWTNLDKFPRSTYPFSSVQSRVATGDSYVCFYSVYVHTVSTVVDDESSVPAASRRGGDEGKCEARVQSRRGEGGTRDARVKSRRASKICCILRFIFHVCVLIFHDYIHIQ